VARTAQRAGLGDVDGQHPDPESDAFDGAADRIDKGRRVLGDRAV